MMTFEEKIKRARELRKSAKFGVLDLEDKDASEVVSLFDGMTYTGELISAGTRINHNGMLFKAAVDLWNTVENNPDNAPDIWERILYHNGIRIIPETITVTSAFAEGEKGYWEADGNVYISKVNNNVYTPEQYADNWKLEGVI